ncbi:hypothetical protein EQ718_10780 [Paracoccus versutus]|nr:hypothetical protein EQ718_10780 [Paracoccus versutus]
MANFTPQFTGWEGVGDAYGNPVPVTSEGIDALLDIWPVFEAFQTRCLAPHPMLDVGACKDMETAAVQGRPLTLMRQRNRRR